MNRRKLLALTSLALTYFYLPISFARTNRNTEFANKTLLHDLFESTIKHLNSDTVGKVYLRESPNDTSLHQLLSQIKSAISSDQNKSNSHHMLAELAIQIKTDFLNNDTIEIDGWLLSKTEVQLCALKFQLYH